MKRNSLAVKFVLLKILHYSIITSFGSFALAYLKSTRALSDSQASALLTLFTLGAFTGQFIFGRLCADMRNILIAVGSGVTNGNTDHLADAFAAGCRDAGIRYTKSF